MLIQSQIMSLKRYFLWFFFICFIFTCLCGVLSAILPNVVGEVLRVVPYLVAMVWTLFRFLKQQKRAPTSSEQKKISLGFTLIYWLYNLSFLVLSIALASRSNPNAWKDFLGYLQEPQFMSIVLIMCLLIAIPLYLLTYWFYGKQAQRMADKMFTK